MSHQHRGKAIILVCAYQFLKKEKGYLNKEDRKIINFNLS